MRISSWFQLCLVASGLAVSTYACGGDDADDDATETDGGTSSGGASSGQNGSSGSSSGSSSSSSSSSGSSGASSGGASSGGASSGGSSGASSSGNVDDAGPDGSVEEDAGSDAGEETDASEGGVVDPVPAVQYLGRWGDLNDNDLDDGPTTSWPGTQAVLRFHGTGVTAVIGQIGATIGVSRYDIVIDGVAQPVLAGQTAALVIANGAAASYTLAAGLADADHTMAVIRRTEPQQGVNNFKSFTITGGAAPKLLAPPPRPTRVIEVLTESTSNGYGVDSPLYLGVPTGGNYDGSRNCGDVSKYHDARKSMPNQLAVRFDAELSLLGMSAIGITANSGGDTGSKFATFYPRINPLVGGDVAANTWSAAAHPADVVLILLGGADFEDDDPAPPYSHVTTAAGFAPDLGNLVDTAHARNPNAYVFMMVGAQIKDSYPSVATGWPVENSNQRTKLTTAMNTVKTAHPASNWLFVKSFDQNDNQALEVGCAYHANNALHTAMATQAIPWIMSATGWL